MAKANPAVLDPQESARRQIEEIEKGVQNSEEPVDTAALIAEIEQLKGQLKNASDRRSTITPIVAGAELTEEQIEALPMYEPGKSKRPGRYKRTEGGVITLY